jgi:hypothetical protein
MHSGPLFCENYLRTHLLCWGDFRNWRRCWLYPLRLKFSSSPLLRPPSHSCFVIQFVAFLSHSLSLLPLAIYSSPSSFSTLFPSIPSSLAILKKHNPAARICPNYFPRVPAAAGRSAGPLSSVEVQSTLMWAPERSELAERDLLVAVGQGKDWNGGRKDAYERGPPGASGSGRTLFRCCHLYVIMTFAWIGVYNTFSGIPG